MVITPFNTMASPAFLRSTSIVPTPSSQAVSARCPTHLDDTPCETTPSDRVTSRPIRYRTMATGIPAEEGYGGPRPPCSPSCRRRPHVSHSHLFYHCAPAIPPCAATSVSRAVHGRAGCLHLELCPS